jgi:predicted nucleic acid-binding protein
MDFLIDANIIIDYLEEREGFFEDAEKVIEICSNKNAYSSLPPHTISTIYYILQKGKPSPDVKLELRGLLEYIDIVPTGKEEIIKALDYEGIEDFEDALQAVCAEKFNAEFIITRDIKGYENSRVRAIAPKEFVEKIASNLN